MLDMKFSKQITFTFGRIDGHGKYVPTATRMICNTSMASTTGAID